MFVDKHIVPMTSAIWSAETAGVRDFPLRFLVQFFQNHGFLQVDDRPQWLTVTGGSREYVRALTRPWADRIRLDTPVVGVERRNGRVALRTRAGVEETFDRVVLACHSDTALAILRRKLAGLSMSQADANHIHHLAKRALGGVKRAVGALYLVTALFGGLGILLGFLAIEQIVRLRIVYVTSIVLFGVIAAVSLKTALRNRWATQLAPAEGGSSAAGERKPASE